MRLGARNRAAFSLAEVILCLTLIVGTLVLVAGVFPFSYQADQKAWRKSSAHRIAASTIERMRGEDFDTISSGFAIVNVEQTPFEVTITVTDSTAPPVKSKNVTCEVAWRTPSGPERYVQDTRIADFHNPD